MLYYKSVMLRGGKFFGLLGLWLGIPLLTLQAMAQDINIKSRLELQEPNSQRLCPQELSAAIETIINRPQLSRSRWGIVVRSLEEDYPTNPRLYQLNGNKYFIPASAAKLLTTAAALSEFDADFQIRTPIYATGKPPHLTSLRIQGKGDPTISVKTLKSIVHQLQGAGIKRIEKLIVEDNYFSAPTINPTWEWLDVYSYFATAVNSLILDENTVTLTLLPQQLGEPVQLRWSNAIAARQWQVDNQALTAPKDTEYNVEIDGILGKPVLNIRGELAINDRPDVWDLAIVDPANYFLDSWRYLLEAKGITIGRGVVINHHQNNPSEPKIATIVSASLPEMLGKINQESNNLYAETLIQLLNKKIDAEQPVEAVEESLSKLGINGDDYVLVDGSGLSRHNLVTPQVLVEVLSLMASSNRSQIYQNSLAIAGVKGTLANRFHQTPVRGKLWGKTGTLTGVGTLAGYLTTADGETLVFSIMVNNSERSSQELRQAIDEIVMLFSQLRKCSETVN